MSDNDILVSKSTSSYERYLHRIEKRLDVGVLSQVDLFAQFNQRNGISKLCKFPRYITAWIAARINEGK